MFRDLGATGNFNSGHEYYKKQVFIVIRIESSLGYRYVFNLQ